MFTLNVKKDLTLPDGRLYLKGHTCNSLNIFEASELLKNYFDVFEPGDELTAELASDQAKVTHYAAAKGDKS